jgi:signal transduction histidine kinase
VTGFGKLIRTTAYRLVAIYLLIFVLFAGFLLGYIAWNARQVVNAQVTETIETEINSLAEVYRNGSVRRLAAVIERRSRQARGFFYILADPQGEVIVGNVADPKPLLDRQPGWHNVQFSRSIEDMREERVPARLRLFTLPNNMKLVVGHDVEEQMRMRHVMRRSAGMSVLLVLLLGGIGAWVVSRRVLRPIDNMTEAASRIMAGNLSERLPVRGVNDELDRLAEHLNLMLNRIGELMNGLRAVSDNVAHDLRTPLTRLRAASEEALRTAKSPEELRGALERTIEESDGLIKVFNALLMIARAEGGSAPAAFADLDLSAIVADVVELYEPVAEEAGLSLANAASAPVIVHGSRELLSQAVANLVDNAIKYGRPADMAETVAPVEISLSSHADTLELAVADHGAGIPPEDRERVLDRFVRLEKSRALPGSGLGLSLVAAIARLHGGKLRLEDNAPGVKAVLSLPARKLTQE